MGGDTTDADLPGVTSPEADTAPEEESNENELENQTNLPDGYISVQLSDDQTVAIMEVEPSEAYRASILSYHMSVLLALGIVAGVLIFNLLSRRWSS